MQWDSVARGPSTSGWFDLLPHRSRSGTSSASIQEIRLMAGMTGNRFRLSGPFLAVIILRLPMSAPAAFEI